MKTYTPEEYKKIYGDKAAWTSAPASSLGRPSIGEVIANSFKAGVNQVKEGFKQVAGTPDKGPSGNPLDLVSGVGKIGSGAINAALSPLSPVTEPLIGKPLNYVADKISNIPIVQKIADSKSGDVASRIAEDVSNYANIAGTVGGAMQAPKAGGAVKAGVSKTVETIGNKTEGALSKVKGSVEGIKEGINNVINPILEEAKRIPERVATNVAEKQAIQQTINKLPTKVAKQAAQDGLEVADVKSLYNIAKDQKTPLKKLAQITKDFAEGKTKTNPIEVVGQPIVQRIKQLESVRGKIGQKLGDVANDLGDVTTKELEPSVLGSLKQVPGLSGLKSVGKSLDFKDTTLASQLSKADQKAIQSIFNEAIKAGTGKQKHLLRQELFEILGGKKKSLSNLTDTQEKAFNAVRKGLSDVLESKNASYKNLSNQYRKVAQPLQDIRGYMKKVIGAPEDIQDMSAGLLARRITSAAKSNPEIRSVLNAMDKATKVAGKTTLSVETLQDFYNILEKYYDIAPKTGFQAQVRQGVEKAVGGPINYLEEKVKSYAGETPAVRQKALESILNEILR